MDSDIPEGRFWMPGEERFGWFSSRVYGIAGHIPVLKNFHEFVIRSLSALEFSRILDIGCGTGTVLLSLAQRKGDFLGYGIDPSVHMVHIAGKRAERLGLSHRVEFARGSNRHVPFGEKFDVICSSLSFHHWKNNAESVAGIMERLEEDGRFIVYEITGDGSLIRKTVRRHLMNRKDFEAIHGGAGTVTEVTEHEGYISATFRRSGQSVLKAVQPAPARTDERDK